MSYTEFLTASAFSFLEGASHPESLVKQAAALGHAAIGIADINSVAGVVRAHVAAKPAGLRLLVGCRLRLTDAPDLICYTENRAAWGRLCRLLTLGKTRAAKGACLLHFADILNHAEGQVFIVVPPAVIDTLFTDWLGTASLRLRGQIYLAAVRRYAPDDAARLSGLRNMAQFFGKQSPRMKCSITNREQDCCRTCCVASARAAPSPKLAICWSRMANAILNPPLKWSACSRNSRRLLRRRKTFWRG
jgi:error-prone DNA polymerase